MRRVLGIVLSLLFLAQGTPSFAGDIQLPSTDASWLDTINYYRVASGLDPVTEDKQMSMNVQKHLTYLSMSDPKFFTGAFVSRHVENPASPFYSAQGATSGQELASTLTNDSSQFVDEWMAAPFHAVGFMREGLRTIGWSSQYNSRSGFYDAGADVLDGLKAIRTKIITFPGNGSVSRLDNFMGESPDPREACGSDALAYKGLPIWVSLTSSPPRKMSAQIATPSGKIISSKPDLCVVNEFTVKSSDPVYGPAGKAIMRNDHMILIIPKTPLAPGLQKVSLSLKGRSKITWSFTVIARPTTIVWSASPDSSSITWDAPPMLSSNPTLGYEVVVGDTKLKKFATFRTLETNFSTKDLGKGQHWVCVRVIDRFRSGDCPNFTSYSDNQSNDLSAITTSQKS